MIDDQSNCSLAKPRLFDQLNLQGDRLPYTLKTCAGTTQTEGRRAKGLVIESLNGHVQHQLPTITECDDIPDSKDEIPTPDVARAHPHLHQIADQIPEVQSSVDILLLIGRDVPPLHKVRESRNGRGNSPWAQRLDLGWLILGNACLDGYTNPTTIPPLRPTFCRTGDPPSSSHVQTYYTLKNQPLQTTTRDLWYEDNDPIGKVIEYRMKVHLFGNTSSPAVATLGLRKTAQVGEDQFGSDAREFVERNFYVDDGLKSLPGSEESIDLLQRTQGMLATANLRLHKIASNDAEVTQAFPSEDRATELCDLDLNKEIKPVQRSLGVYWDLETDTFTFRVSQESKPFTRRGVLSVINSLFGPLGIASPVVIQGKMLLRSMSTHLKNRQLGEWDEPLPDQHHPAWKEWYQSLSSLQDLKIPRCYTPASLADANRTELHVFYL